MQCHRFRFPSYATVLLLALAVCCAVTPAGAGVIEVTGETQVLLDTGRSFSFEFGVWNYGVHNPGSSPLPTTLGFQTYFALPADANLQSIPYSSSTTMAGSLVEAYLQSIDGKVSVPLTDVNASRLGLGPGILAPVIGSVCGMQGCIDPIALVHGSVQLTQEASAALFGANLTSDRAAARIVLTNRGTPVTFGLGVPYSIGQSFQLPGVSGAGPVTTAGIPGKVMHYNPEPGTVILMSLPLAFLLVRCRKASRR